MKFKLVRSQGMSIGDKYGSLVEALRRMVKNSHSRHDVDLIVLGFAQFSKTYLNQKISTGKYYLNAALLGKDAIDDVAIDSVAELFASDPSGRYNTISQSFSGMNELDMIDAISLVRQVVSQATHQNMIKVFKQVDPSGWKMYKNLSAVKERREYVRSFHDFSVEYLYYSEDYLDAPMGLNPESEPMGEREAQTILFGFLRSNTYLPEAVEGFLQELRRHPGYQQFIAKLSLHRHIKAYYQEISVNIEDVAFMLSDNSINPGKINESDQQKYYDQALQSIHETMHEMYVLKNKITTDMAELYAKTLEKYFQDLLFDGDVDRLPAYARNSGLIDGKNDWKDHQGKLEYLIKKTKEQLRQQYEADFLKSPHRELKKDDG